MMCRIILLRLQKGSRKILISCDLRDQGKQNNALQFETWFL